MIACWVVVCAIGTTITLGNWWIIVRYFRTGESASSVPVFGGVALGLSLQELGLGAWGWIAALLDPGSGFGILHGAACVGRWIVKSAMRRLAGRAKP